MLLVLCVVEENESQLSLKFPNVFLQLYKRLKEKKVTVKSKTFGKTMLTWSFFRPPDCCVGLGSGYGSGSCREEIQRAHRVPNNSQNTLAFCPKFCNSDKSLG